MRRGGGHAVTGAVGSAEAMDADQDVTPLELFFDLVFVFAMTQVSGFLAHHLTWLGVLRGAALLAVLWWAWVTYSWLTNAVPAEEALPARLTVLAAMAAMLVVALAVPGAFDEAGVLFGAAYLVVRLLHVVLYALATDPETRGAILRLAPGFLLGPALLVPAGLLDGAPQAALWLAAIALDYGAPLVGGVAGFRIRAQHFVERHRLIVIIALGESLVAIGIGIDAAGLALTADVVGTALLGIALVVGFWWLYFDRVVDAAECRLVEATGDDRAALARDSYSYLHLPMVAGIVAAAVGIEQSLVHLGDPLPVVPAAMLGGGAALYLVGHLLFRLRDTGTLSRPRIVGALAATLAVPLGLSVGATTALAALTGLFAALALYETVQGDATPAIGS
jgi:low temperature requirement protein LtrA